MPESTATNGSASHGCTPIVNGAEHAWVINDSRFPIDPNVASCPNNLPDYEYSAGYLLSQMRVHGVDKVVISHVCYYGRDNSYTSYCAKTYPDKFAGIGLLVGHRLYSPDAPDNPARLERAIVEEHLVGMRLSPIYDQNVVWLNDPVSYPLWKKAEVLGAVFNIFLAPGQISQVADMAERFPGVNVVIDHFAMIDIAAPDSEGFDQLLALSRLPNVYIRTSLHNSSREQMPYRDMWPYLRRVYDRFGPQRMIYANFYELLIMKDLIPFFTAEDKDWILGKTALKVYRFGS
ncbi:MAG: amidohydrolase family protein [Candidatus Poribacteria bacterium]|nr:amidohydrolase family protein [Candidatus Poribacteria bacterium]